MTMLLFLSISDTRRLVEFGTAGTVGAAHPMVRAVFDATAASDALRLEDAWNLEEVAELTHFSIGELVVWLVNRGVHVEVREDGLFLARLEDVERVIGEDRLAILRELQSQRMAWKATAVSSNARYETAAEWLRDTHEETRAALKSIGR